MWLVLFGNYVLSTTEDTILKVLVQVLRNLFLLQLESRWSLNSVSPLRLKFLGKYVLITSATEHSKWFYINGEFLSSSETLHSTWPLSLQHPSSGKMRTCFYFKGRGVNNGAISSELRAQKRLNRPVWIIEIISSCILHTERETPISIYANEPGVNITVTRPFMHQFTTLPPQKIPTKYSWQHFNQARITGK